MKTYVTFGQTHVHEIDNKTFDKDCVGVIHCRSAVEGRALAFDYFGPKFCFEYPEQEFDLDDLHYFPRGLIEVNQPVDDLMSTLVDIARSTDKVRP